MTNKQFYEMKKNAAIKMIHDQVKDLGYYKKYEIAKHVGISHETMSKYIEEAGLSHLKNSQDVKNSMVSEITPIVMETARVMQEKDGFINFRKIGQKCGCCASTAKKIILDSGEKFSYYSGWQLTWTVEYEYDDTALLHPFFTILKSKCRWSVGIPPVI